MTDASHHIAHHIVFLERDALDANVRRPTFALILALMRSLFGYRRDVRDGCRHILTLHDIQVFASGAPRNRCA